MKKILLALMIAFAISSIASCNDAKEETTKKIKVDKHGSCLIQLAQINKDGFTIVTFSDSVYDKSGKFLKVIQHVDTIPSLGITRDTLETDKVVEYEDEDGETQSYYKDTIFTHLKPYQLFITVSKK